MNSLVARQAIQAVGKIALRVSARANICVDKLLSLLSIEIDYVTSETIIVMTSECWRGREGGRRERRERGGKEEEGEKEGEEGKEGRRGRGEGGGKEGGREREGRGGREGRGVRGREEREGGQ